MARPATDALFAEHAPALRNFLGARRRGTEAWSREEPPRTPDADEAVLASELRAAVRRAIAELPPAQREVIELRHREGLIFREIAARLGRPLGTVLAQMRAALRRVSVALESYR